MSAVATWLQEVANQFFASPLASTLVVSAFGAFAGAFAANRVQTKRAVVTELNSINSALLLCFSICNRAVSLKKQHVKPTYELYHQSKRAFEAARGRRGPSSAPIALRADLQTMTPIIMPNDDRIRGAEFLFDGATRTFVAQIGDMAYKARMTRASLSRFPDHPSANRLIDEEEEFLTFLRDKNEDFEEMFKRYLDLSKVGL